MNKINLKTTVGRIIIDVNKNQLITDIKQLVDELENKDSLNKKLYDKIVAYNINKKVLDQMIERVRVYASYDDNNTYINFPYEDWIDQLIVCYTGEIK